MDYQTLNKANNLKRSIEDLSEELKGLKDIFNMHTNGNMEIDRICINDKEILQRYNSNTGIKMSIGTLIIDYVEKELEKLGKELQAL